MNRWCVTVLMTASLMSVSGFFIQAAATEKEPENLAQLTLPVEIRAAYDTAWNEPLMPVFQQAATGYQVPLDLLLILGRLGSGFEDRGGAPTIERGYGVMALRENTLGGDSLALAASLTQVSTDQLKVDPVANIRGAAAVLDAYATDAGIDRMAGIEAWAPVVEQYAGLDKESSQIFTVGVYRYLQAGSVQTNSKGETFRIAPQTLSIDPDTLGPPTARMQSPDYGPAAWDPAASCNYSTATHSSDTIIVHTIEGSYAGAISWFKNCNSSVSSHYVLAEDGRICQCVLESQTAWHVGCLNSRSIGFEHEGYASSASHPTTLYDASAALARDICNRRGVPKAHNSCPPGILGHVDANACVCGGSHWDPGGGWDWGYYIARVSAGVDAAQLTSHNIPNWLTVSQSVSVSITMRNSGTGTWATANGYRLGAVGDSDPFTSFSRVDISGSVGPDASYTFTFTMTAPATPGTYQTDWRMVHDGVAWFGDTLTKQVVVVGSGPQPPTITQQPTNQTIPPFGTANFTVEAVGETPLAYQWQKDGSDLSDGGRISGATSATLQVVNAEASDQGSYRCTVTNSLGSATSNAASLVLAPTVYIVESRSGGQNFGKYSETGTWANSSGKSSASGVTAGIGSRYGSTYRSSAGEKHALFSADLILEGPYEVYATWGANNNRRTPILHRVTHADGTTDINVDQSAVANAWISLGTFNFIAGTDVGKVDVNNLNIDASGSMYADAVKWEYRGSAPAAPTITQHPASQDVCPGAVVTFTTAASGTGTLTYQWQKNGANLSNVGHYSGVQTATLTVSNADTSDAANYRCVVSNAGGSTNSNPAALTVKASTAVTQQPQSVTVDAGATATFSVMATGDGTLAYQWRKDSQPLSDDGRIVGARTTTLTINSTITADAGSYMVEVTGGCGDDSSQEVTLTVNTLSPPQVTAAVSRKTHGSAGVFDIDVFAAGAVECRKNGPTQVLVAFDQVIQQTTGTVNDVSITSGTVSELVVNGNQLTVTMSGVTDVTLLTMAFPGMRNAGGTAVVQTLCFRVLLGDATGDGLTNVLDLLAIRNKLNMPVNNSNFTSDITGDGNINVLDLLATRNNLNKNVAGSCP